MRNARLWRELYRCDDLLQARAVATSIAAMEFDVRLHSLAAASPGDRWAAADDSAVDDREGEPLPDDPHDLPGPYIVAVRDDTWPQLADVLLEIIAEQQEFDEMLELRRHRHQQRLVVILSITSAAEIYFILRLLDP